MTNIWTQVFEDIRKPYFEMEDPYTLSEKMAKKDWDRDGKIESEKDEVWGSRARAAAAAGKPFTKKKKVEEGVEGSAADEKADKAGMKRTGMTEKEWEASEEDKKADAKLAKKMKKEEVEQLDELSVNKMLAYTKKAEQNRSDLNKKWDTGTATHRERMRVLGREEGQERAERNIKQKTGKNSWQMNALDRLKASVKKEEYVDEAQVANRDPDKYEGGQDKKYAHVRGEKRPMPPRGHKDREAFEKWYRANVKEETLVEVDKTKQSQKKMEPMPPGKSNKVVIGPQIKEEVQEWVDELVEEGYDLSEFTWDEMTEIYESVELNEGSSDVGPVGDAQTVAVDTQSKKLARARIQKDMADVKYQRAVATNESFDSIVEYLAQRSDAFENLEEGVFDPKKSKLRPASERMARTITPAQRTADKKAAARTAEIHSKGETVLQGLRSSGTRGRVQTTPAAKPAAPAANRTVKGRYDKLAKAASSVLKDIQSK